MKFRRQKIDYNKFLESKIVSQAPSGFNVDTDDLNPMLFDWQKVLVRWSLYRGKSGIFAGCGLGKTPMQLDWSEKINRKTNKDILILAPLAVSHQTKREGEKFGIDVNVCKTQDDVIPGINITNYERLHLFDPNHFPGIVLDESGIIKSFTGKIRNQIIEMFIETPYKLCCTATPSPNDYTELGNHSEFLGVMTRPEMLSMFFINDAGDTGVWRLKGHVKDNRYWEWMASWGVMIRMPSDIGYDDAGFKLPKLNMIEHVIKYKGPIKEGLFVREAKTLSERRDARRESMQERVGLVADIINASNDTWITWCDLNAESIALKNAIKDAVEVTGSDSTDHKEQALIDFQNNQIKCLVTKPSIAGFGLNLQNCHNMAFVGLSDSYEQLYQAIRRCWRFGQTKQVDAHIVIGEREGAVVANIKRKEHDMELMFGQMIKHMSKLTQTELKQMTKTYTEYNPGVDMILPKFLEVR